MQKQDWIKRIEMTLTQGHVFAVSCSDPDKASLLFACDLFRRRKHRVNLHFNPTQRGILVLHVSILPFQNAIECTVKRDQAPEEIIAKMTDPNIQHVSVRGCGTVINTVATVVQWAIHHGWFVEKSLLNTLVQNGSHNSRQRNTTLMVVLQRGSSVDSI
jgi:hypothetical protein